MNSFNFVGTNFRGLGKKAFRGIVKFVDCRLQKIKKSFEILKFVDFHKQIWIIVVHYQLVTILIII